MKKFFFLPIILIFISCSKREQKLKELGGFEKIDSITVEITQGLIFQDIDFHSKKILFLNKSETNMKVILMDFDGNANIIFPLTTIANIRIKDLLAPLSFQIDNSITAFSSKELINYELTGNIKKVYPFSEKFNQQISKSTIYNESKNKLLLCTRDLLHISNKDLTKFNKVNILESINIETGQSKFLLQFPDMSIFRNGKYFSKGDWYPAFMVDKDEIHIIFGIEPVIYTYKNDYPNNLIKSNPIRLNNYQHFKGYNNYSSTLNNVSHSFSSGKISSIQKIGEHFLITYFPGFDITHYEKNLNSKSTEEVIKFIREIKINHPYRMAVIDSLGNPLADFVPKGLDINKIIIRNGELWIPEIFDLTLNKKIFKIYKINLKME